MEDRAGAAMKGDSTDAGHLPARLSAADHVPELVRKLCAVAAEFERLFPGRNFTPDGHLVGSIGEVVATHYGSLTLIGRPSVTDSNPWEAVFDGHHRTVC
ncbi:MAG: hypothetical protein H6948_17335 [Zoogloeaceae bacterium]|nr:hypothetical protein [Zoogloeaceae bacterium]